MTFEELLVAADQALERGEVPCLPHSGSPVALHCKLCGGSGIDPELSGMRDGHIHLVECSACSDPFPFAWD